jgi:hypothetical protein
MVGLNTKYFLIGLRKYTSSKLQFNLKIMIKNSNIAKREIDSLHQEFKTYGKNAREWIQKCKMLLPKIQKQEVWKKKGFTSIYEYARVLAGMSTHAVDDALWVMKKLEARPHLKKVAKKKGLNAIRPVLTIATEKDEKEWAKKAQKMSQNTLKMYVKNCREKGLVHEEKQSKECFRVNPGQKNQEKTKTSIYMKLDVQTIERLKKIKGEKDWDELLNMMIDVMEEEEGAGARKRLEAMRSARAIVTARSKDVPAPVNTGKRYIPAKIKRHVIKKTGGCCAYPGCTKPYDILHHTKRFAIDSTHDSDTLKPLCKGHERIAHEGLIENEESSSGDAEKWSIKMQADVLNPKYQVDEVVGQYYMPM